LEWWGNSPVAPPAPLSLRLRNALLNPAAGVGALRRKLGLAPPLQVRPDPCLELEWCEKLEQLYRTECERWRVLGDRYLEVDYDRLLREPEGAVKVMAAFTDCRASRAEQAAAAAIVWKGSGVPAASGAGAGSRR
jgi:hypothetical protein